MTISRPRTSHDNSVKDNFYEDSKSEQKTQEPWIRIFVVGFNFPVLLNDG